MKTSKGLAGPVAFVVFGSMFLFSTAYLVNEMPDSNPLKDSITVPEASTASAPPDAGLIDQAEELVNGFLDIFLGLNSENPVFAIILAVLKAGIAVSIALIVKDMIPFT